MRILRKINQNRLFYEKVGFWFVFVGITVLILSTGTSVTGGTNITSGKAYWLNIDNYDFLYLTFRCRQPILGKKSICKRKDYD